MFFHETKTSEVLEILLLELNDNSAFSNAEKLRGDADLSLVPDRFTISIDIDGHSL